MRIIAGSAKGRVLAAPKDHAVIRPTADRAKETLFNVLGQQLDGEAVLDLYAGTGALGLEALSRGAARAVLVDQHREALALCRQNVQALGFAAQAQVLAAPVARALETLGRQGARFSLVFVDPPYRAQAGLAALEGLLAQGLLLPLARVVLEHDKREVLPQAVGALTQVDARAFGDTRLSIFHLTGAAASAHLEG